MRSSSSTRSRWPSRAAVQGRDSSITGPGSQYVSLLFGDRCREAGIEISMGWTSARDNEVAERFFASLTKDLLRRRSLRSRAEAWTALFDYIEVFYNTIRLHSVAV